jgi:N-acylneuraminate cytidylyltransferase
MNYKINNKKLNIVALIPARSGSKGIIDKNIKLYKGLPLIAHSINIAKESKYIQQIYVSTDSKEYAELAVQYGAITPFLRPLELSDDLSSDYECFNHFLEWFINNNYDGVFRNLQIEQNPQVMLYPGQALQGSPVPDIIVHLRPTYPNRLVEVLDKSIELFLENYDNYDSLRSVVLLQKTPYKMYYIEDGLNNLIPFIKNDKNNYFKEPFNQARQNFPDTYLHNGCIDIVKSSVIINQKLLSGKKIFPFIMDENETNDIDDINDFLRSENTT